ncbi:unnamed protein product, partial [Rotaria magnacalcarata]
MKPDSSTAEKDWKYVEYLIIDEIFIVGLRLLARLNELLTLGKRAPPEVPFGGINIILFDDYIQYMPVLDKPLYANLERRSSTCLPTEADVQYGLRTEINNRAAVDKAKVANIPLVVVVARDKIRSKIAHGDVMYERLPHLPDNKAELLPGLLHFVPDMPVLLTDNIACELRLSNGTQG